jgi:hypothetical protein
MSLQFITDDKGFTTGVFIPINDWDTLKSKFEGIEEEVIEIPEWQKEIVSERVKNTNPDEYLSWEEVSQKLKFD